MADNGLRTRDPAAIQAEIDRARDEISRSVLALRERVSSAKDWRRWVRGRPRTLFLIALAAGLWLGFRPRRA